MDDFDYEKHVTLEDGHAHPDHITAIADLTSTAASDWTEVDGPDSRVGVSYWYAHEAQDLTAYVSNDQRYVSIEVTNVDGDTIANAGVDLNELELG